MQKTPTLPLRPKEQADIRLLDRAGQFVCWLTKRQAQGYLDRHEGVARGHKKLRAVKLLGENPVTRHHGPMRERGMGESHRRDNYWNPRGVWSIDGISQSTRKFFLKVVEDCRSDLPKAA